MLASVVHNVHWRLALLLPSYQPVRRHPDDVLRFVLERTLLVATVLTAAGNALMMLRCLCAFGSNMVPPIRGAMETALIAGLTVVGVPFGPAVADVLSFRLLTYWLPILVGVAAFRYLERE